MKRKRTLSPDNPEQSKRFIDLARELGADESQDAFERAFEKVVRPKRTSHPNQERAVQNVARKVPE